MVSVEMVGREVLPPYRDNTTASTQNINVELKQFSLLYCLEIRTAAKLDVEMKKALRFFFHNILVKIPTVRTKKMFSLAVPRSSGQEKNICFFK